MPYWPSPAPGITLGLALFVTFLISGHGLGASGFFTRMTAWLGGELARPATEANSYLGPFLKGANPLASWINWEIVGVLIGAFLAAVTSGRFRMQVDGAPKLGGGDRIALALGGGILTGFGARLHQRRRPVRRRAAGRCGVPLPDRLLRRRDRSQLPGAEGLGMTLPLYDKGITSGLFCGVLFGYALESAGFASPRKLTAQFRFTDWAEFKVMFTAIIVAGIGLYAVIATGLMPAKGIFIPTTFFWATLTGGALVGAGMAVSGYCPGTSSVALASGRLDGLFFMIGMVLGTGLFAGMFNPLKGFYFAGKGPQAQTLSELFGIPTWAVLAILIIIAVLGFALGSWMERREGGPLTAEQLNSDDETGATW